MNNDSSNFDELNQFIQKLLDKMDVSMIQLTQKITQNRSLTIDQMNLANIAEFIKWINIECFKNNGKILLFMMLKYGSFRSVSFCILYNITFKMKSININNIDGLDSKYIEKLNKTGMIIIQNWIRYISQFNSKLIQVLNNALKVDIQSNDTSQRM